ncbi:MAG TPA: 4-alpha-glucanotransferase, partial [Gemmatimonadales bacterium]|nr:4-alpha-glucanotransferase [Gemmatimonadales bacterium]
MDELRTLRVLAKAMGVQTRYTDGLGKKVVVAPETLLRVCAALGAPVEHPADARGALRARRAAASLELLPKVLVAWDGILPPLALPVRAAIHAELHLAEGGLAPLEISGTDLRPASPLPFGYHRLSIGPSESRQTCTVISSPMQAWRRAGSHRSWGVGTQLAALRSARSRSVGDLQDFEMLCRWVRVQGGDLVTALPLLPTFNARPAEPSPYSPVSRLFWSELMLDLGSAHRPAPASDLLDVSAADAEVRAALAGQPVPDSSMFDPELISYARFRAAQARLGRNWRDWPAEARDGTLRSSHLDPEEERFHLVAQSLLRRQLHDLREHLEKDGMRLGLDLAVGVHPDGYDPWT